MIINRKISGASLFSISIALLLCLIFGVDSRGDENPFPFIEDGASHLALSTVLSWPSPKPDLSYNVYFGTDANNLTFKPLMAVRK